MNEIDQKFPPLKNDLLLKAARGEEVSRIPIWVMRQAGRYLPEFREVRLEHEFFKVCRTRELACEVTMQPLRRFDLDGSIIFSDILVVPQALGMTVEMVKGKGPVLPEPLVTPDDLKRLNREADVKEELKYVYEAITLTRKTIDGKVPLIGFAGAPWTLMVYMIEGGGSKTYSKAKSWLYKYPEESRDLLNLLSTFIVDYLVEQVKAGAQLLQVFDSHAGELPKSLFISFILPCLKKIGEDVKEKLGPNLSVPMILFAKGAHYAFNEINETNYDVIALDWTMDVEKARECFPNKTLMGNLDPCALYADKEKIDELAKELVEKFGTRRWIANLGHGMYPDMSPDHLEALVNSVHKHSQKDQTS